MASIHENDKMRSRTIFPFDDCKPLTEQEIYTDASLDGGWLDEVFDKKDVLCALKGLQKEVELEYALCVNAKYLHNTREIEVYKMGLSCAFHEVIKWFPILQSETLKTTDDGNAHLPQSNQTEDVRTSESLVGGSEQTSTYTTHYCDVHAHAKGEPCNKRCSFSQPVQEKESLGLPSGDSQCGDAGELKTVRNLLTLQTERILEQKDAPRKGTR